MKKLVYIIIILTSINFSFAQHSEPSTLKAYPLNEKIKIDGILNENVWKEVTHITNFTQRELNYGQPVSERTEVAVV